MFSLVVKYRKTKTSKDVYNKYWIEKTFYFLFIPIYTQWNQTEPINDKMVF